MPVGEIKRGPCACRDCVEDSGEEAWPPGRGQGRGRTGRRGGDHGHTAALTREALPKPNGQESREDRQRNGVWLASLGSVSSPVKELTESK